jgi:hypothetical protein
LRIAPDAEREVLPTPKEGLPTIDTALPERPAPKEQPAEVTPIKAAASDKTAILPEIAPIAEPSRPKSSQGQAQVPQESAPVDAPQPQVKPQPEVKPQPKKMFEAKPAAPDGFPEIHVQVRPVDLEASAEEKAAPAQGVPVGNNGEAVTPAPKQPLAAAEEKASAIAPEQPVSQTPQPAVAQTQDEMAAPAKTQPEPVKAEAPAAQAEPAPESEIPAAEQETHEPLNLSLEDMFMAETKYDMFVEVEPMEESASVGQTSQTGSAKKANHKK